MPIGKVRLAYLSGVRASKVGSGMMVIFSRLKEGKDSDCPSLHIEEEFSFSVDLRSPSLLRKARVLLQVHQLFFYFILFF